MAPDIKYTSTPITAGSASYGRGAPGGNAPGGNVPTMLPSTSASAVSASIIHIVALDNGVNQAHIENNSSTFSKMRVTIHTTGAWPNSPHSDNHVTILLILDQGGAVQIDMRTDVEDRRGQLYWKLVNYQKSSSGIKAVVYDLGAPVAVWTLYRAIRYDWKLHQYLFSSGGSGCHFWNYVLLRNMTTDTTRFALNAEVPAHAWDVFGKWYSRTGAERPNQSIRQGEFRSDEQWYEDWFGEDGDEDEEEDDKMEE